MQKQKDLLDIYAKLPSPWDVQGKDTAHVLEAKNPPSAWHFFCSLHILSCPVWMGLEDSTAFASHSLC